MPEDVLKQTTPATELLEKKKELADVEDALEAQKEDFRLRMESLKQRRAELERKEYQLQENLLKFDRFLKENDARRERAERKADEENTVAAEREQEIDSLRKRLRTLKETKERQKEIISRYTKFEDFLKHVLTKSGEFQEISELIDRHATLITTNKVHMHARVSATPTHATGPAKQPSDHPCNNNTHAHTHTHTHTHTLSLSLTVTFRIYESGNGKTKH